MADIYTLCEADTIPLVIFDSPHSGTCYPNDFDYCCDQRDLQACEDEYVDDLFADAPKLGGSLLCAQFPRSYIDPNRAEDDIDPALLAQPWEGDITPSRRSAAGIGLIRRQINTGDPVYNRLLTQEEIERRISAYYRPYHSALEQLIEASHAKHGKVYHINCHSMPDEAAKPRRPLGFINGKVQTADFVLGDRDATSCSTAFTRALRQYIQGLGYSATVNDPFKGVEIVKRYGQPSRGRHSLQLEINKSLYMDEVTGEKNKNYAKIKAHIRQICTFIINYAQG